MEGRLLFKNCALLRADGRLRTGVSVLVEGERVSRVAPADQLRGRPGDWEVACAGRLLVPGFVDCHARLLAASALVPSGEPLLHDALTRQAAAEACARAVTTAELEAVTSAGLARAALAGVTFVVEHLRRPTDVEGALLAQQRAAQAVGVRLYVGHATRGSGAGLDDETSALAQLEANALFSQSVRHHPRVRGAIGFDQTTTCSDPVLRRAGRVREELGAGALFHLEDERLPGRHRVMDRLETFGLLGPGTVATDGEWLSRAEATKLGKTRTFLAWSPASASLHGGRDEKLEGVIAEAGLVGLGTAGEGTLVEAHAAAFRWIVAAAREGRLLDPDGKLAQVWSAGPAELRTMVFGAPSGDISEGAVADLVVLDEVPAEAGMETFAAQVWSSIGRARVAWTVVGGQVLVREGRLLSADPLALFAEEAKAVQALRLRVLGHAGP
jgi:5-methylthioadenosine/S-adenosylhomocysteine deaminase